MRKLSVAFVLIVALGFIAPARGDEGNPATKPASAEIARREAFFKKNIVDAYEKVGRRNPKWDADARKVLALSVQRWMLPTADPDLDWQILHSAEDALRAKCDDPLVLYNQVHALLALQIGAYPDPATLKTLERNISDSKYAPFLKVYVFVRLSNFTQFMAGGGVDSANVKQRLMQAAMENLPGMLAERDLPQAKVADVCTDLTEIGLALDGDRKPTIEKICQIMVKAQPQAPLTDLFKGIAWRKYAWDARGNGFAGTVTAEGSRLFAERLVVAKEALAAALTKDPQCAAAAAEMISVQLGGDGNRAEMEKYFQRAIAADPDCYSAYDRKLYFLTPKWHGDIGDQLKFGRECLATRRWDDRIPFLLLQSQKNIVEDRFRQLSGNSDDRDVRRGAWAKSLAELYKGEPSTWEDAKALYEGYLAHNPSAAAERVDYMWAAAMTEHPEVALEQMDALLANKDPAYQSMIYQPPERLLYTKLHLRRWITRWSGGDAKGALSDVQAYSRGLAPDDPDLNYAKLWLWMCQTKLGDKARADRDLRKYRKNLGEPRAGGWPGTIARFFLGEIKEADFLSAAESSDAASRNDHLCEAWYYAAEIRSMNGDTKTAAEYLAKCIATGQQTFSEYDMAKIELKRLRK